MNSLSRTQAGLNSAEWAAKIPDPGDVQAVENASGLGVVLWRGSDPWLKHELLSRSVVKKDL